MTTPTEGDSAYEALRVERRGPVGWIIFNRPDALNAMNARMLDELERAWGDLGGDPAVRVIVTTGEGRGFNTGVDLKELAGNPEAMREQARRTKRFDLRFTGWHCGVAKPVVCAVNGICAGGGLHFVADADIVIAARDAEFTDPHVSVGQASVYELIGLLRKMPVEAVMRMALLGRHERLGAARAHVLGMVSEVIDPPERLREAAQELGERIAANSPTAMAHAKRALWNGLEYELTEACRLGARELVAMWGHSDQVEGPQAFAERRPPHWADPDPGLAGPAPLPPHGAP